MDDLNLGMYPKMGIYTDFYGMNYWQDSFGFIVILGAVGVYALGLLLSIIFDIQPQKKLKFRFMRDFRSIDNHIEGKLLDRNETYEDKFKIYLEEKKKSQASNKTKEKQITPKAQLLK